MSRQIHGLLAVVAMVPSLAFAQFKSVDHGADLVDSNGLMWANTVGIDGGWSGYPNAQTGGSGGAGSAQAWVAGLNATDYGGYNNWTLATGVGTDTPNTTTNQLGELFSSDCGFSAGASSAGKTCGGFTALNTTLQTDMIYLSSSPNAGNGPGASAFNQNFYFWMYADYSSSGQLWNNDTQFAVSGVGVFVGTGDALAVRETPEIDPASAASGLTLLLGGLAVLRGRRKPATMIRLDPLRARRH
jgi:hypothetical protein